MRGQRWGRDERSSKQTRERRCSWSAACQRCHQRCGPDAASRYAKLGPRGRHELVLTIERGISLKAAAAADPVSPNEREPGRRFGISNPVSRIVR